MWFIYCSRFSSIIDNTYCLFLVLEPFFVVFVVTGGATRPSKPAGNTRPSKSVGNTGNVLIFGTAVLWSK